eukprot:Polyplicarium_translucidae@DN2950_c1_g1_i2.p1
MILAWFYQIRMRGEPTLFAPDFLVLTGLATLARWTWVPATALTESRAKYGELVASTAACLLVGTELPWSGGNPHVPRSLRCWILAPAALLFALCFHHGRDAVSVHLVVSLSSFLDALALLPQMHVATVATTITPELAVFLGVLWVSRALQLAGWLVLNRQGEGYVAPAIAEVFQLLSLSVLGAQRLRRGRSRALLAAELSFAPAELEEVAKLEGGRCIVGESGLPLAMQEEAIKIVAVACETEREDSNVARLVKEAFDERYGGTWHCIVGRQFEASICHEAGHYFYAFFSIGSVLIFQT